MEFCEKLQQLRKQEGLTQEELARLLFVSRTAISKWESGRGYPSIDSLKAIAHLFSTSIDELLSSEKLIVIVEKDHIQNKLCSVFGALDICSLLLFFLPLFAQRENDFILTVPLITLTTVQSYLRVIYFLLVIGMFAIGILTLAFRRSKYIPYISLTSTLLVMLIFIISSQVYPSIFLFVFSAIKIFIFIKRR